MNYLFVKKIVNSIYNEINTIHFLASNNVSEKNSQEYISNIMIFGPKTEYLFYKKSRKAIKNTFQSIHLRRHTNKIQFLYV